MSKKDAKSINIHDTEQQDTPSAWGKGLRRESESLARIGLEFATSPNQASWLVLLPETPIECSTHERGQIKIPLFCLPGDSPLDAGELSDELWGRCWAHFCERFDEEGRKRMLYRLTIIDRDNVEVFQSTKTARVPKGGGKNDAQIEDDEDERERSDNPSKFSEIRELRSHNKWLTSELKQSYSNQAKQAEVNHAAFMLAGQAQMNGFHMQHQMMELRREDLNATAENAGADYREARLFDLAERVADQLVPIFIAKAQAASGGSAHTPAPDGEAGPAVKIARDAFAEIGDSTWGELAKVDGAQEAIEDLRTVLATAQRDEATDAALLEGIRSVVPRLMPHVGKMAGIMPPEVGPMIFALQKMAFPEGEGA